MFCISVLTPSFVLPSGLTERLTSHLIEPCSILHSETFANLHFYKVVISSCNPKKKASRKTCFFLSNPKDWYGITRRVYGIRRKATAWHHAQRVSFLRIDYIQHFVLIPYRRQAADFIHAYRRDLCYKFILQEQALSYD